MLTPNRSWCCTFNRGCSISYPVVTCSGVNLASYNLTHGTQYTLAVEAVGKPGITNRMSQTVNYTP